MNVAYVVKRYPSLSQTFVVNEILAHEAAGTRVRVFALRGPREAERQPAVDEVRAPVTYLPGAGRGALEQALSLAQLARQHGIGHLHAHFANSATSVTRLAASLAGLPYSFTAHARDIFHETVVPQELRCKIVDAQAVVTVSEFNLAHLRGLFGAEARNVHRLYNGLDLRRFRFEPRAPQPVPVVAAVGRLVEKKGFEVLVDACALLRARGRAMRCRIVGDGPLAEALAARVQARGVSDCVELMGARTHHEVLDLVRQADVLAAPCLVGDDGDRDGLPTVLLEAMAMGTACVSTEVAGIPELVRHERTGLLVRQRDAHGLADALARLLDDAALRRRLAANARALMEAEFDVHRNAARLRELFGRRDCPGTAAGADTGGAAPALCSKAA